MKKLLVLIFLLCSLCAGAQEPEPGADFYLDFLTAVVYENNNQPAQAIEFYNKSLAKYPSSKYIKTLILQNALTAGQEKNYTAIAKEVSSYDDAASLMTYANYAWMQGSLKDAAQYYKRVLGKDSDNLRAALQYFTLLKGTDFEGAIKFINSYAAQNPQYAPGLYYEAAGAYAQNKNLEMALKTYSRAIKEDPHLVEAYAARAKIFEYKKDYSSALKEYLKVEENGDADQDIYVNIGALYVLEKNIPAASIQFQKVLVSDPGNIMANQFLAAIAEDEKDYETAIKYLEACSNYKTNADQQLRASLYAARMGQSARAAGILSNAYNNLGKSVEVGYFYAVALQDTGDHKAASKIFKEILSQNPNYEKARLMYGVSLESLGDLKGMEKQMRLVIEQNPDNSDALNSLGYTLLEQNKKFEEALQHITQALILDPLSYATIDSLGWYYFKTKDYDNAEKYLMIAYSMQKDEEIAGHIAMVYFKKKDFKKAKEYFDLAQHAKYAKEIKKTNKELGL